MASVVLRYLVAVGLVGVAVLFTSLLRPWLEPLLSVTFVLAIAASAWWVGLGPSLLNVLLSAIAIDYYVIPPLGTFAIGGKLLGEALFLVVGVTVAWLSFAVRRSRDRLARQQRETEQARQQAEQAWQQAEQTRQQAEQTRQQAEQARQQAEQARQVAEQAQRVAELAQQEAEEAREQAEKASRAKDDFLALASHELRNPLAAIQGALDVLQILLAGESRTGRPLDILRRNVGLQARLVGDLLDLSRIRSGKIKLQRGPVELADIVQAVVQDQLPAAAAAGVALAVQAQPGIWVHGDRNRLQQIVLNLLSNAIKFSPQGQVWIEVRGVNERASIVVADTGIGIDRELLDQIFEPFRQGDVTHAPGMGLGLSLVRSLAELHQGRAWAESAGPGRGSRFTVELPAVAAPALQPAAEHALLPQRGARLLLVEDNPDTQAMLAQALRLKGYEVELAASAEEALDKLGHSVPQAILADIGLPGMDGNALLRRVREDERLHDVPALAVTGFGEERDVLETQDAGFTGHFVKPVDVEELDLCLRKLLKAA